MIILFKLIKTLIERSKRKFFNITCRPLVETSAHLHVKSLKGEKTRRPLISQPFLLTRFTGTAAVKKPRWPLIDSRKKYSNRIIWHQISRCQIVLGPGVVSITNQQIKLDSVQLYETQIYRRCQYGKQTREDIATNSITKPMHNAFSIMENWHFHFDHFK